MKFYVSFLMGVTSRGVLVFRDVSEKKDILLIAWYLFHTKGRSENAIGFDQAQLATDMQLHDFPAIDFRLVNCGANCFWIGRVHITIDGWVLIPRHSRTRYA